MKGINKKYLLRYGFPLLIAIFAGVIYLITLAPSVMPIDSGELAAVQYTGGIAHPTGYPLFTLTGWLFSRIAWLGTPIRTLNFLCLIWCCAALFFFMRSTMFFLGKMRIKSKQEKTGQETNSIPQWSKDPHWQLNTIAAGTGGLLFAFSSTLWAQSSAVEVYSLHIFLLSLICWFLIRAWFHPSKSPKFWLLAAGALALAFANHMTTILILPGLAYLFIMKFGPASFLSFPQSIRSFWVNQNQKAVPWSPLLVMVGVFIPIVGLLYAWLPLRAVADPPIAWGDPQTWDSFFRHVSGNQYSVWMFSSTRAAVQNFKVFWGNFPSEFGYIGLPIALVGLYYSLSRFPKIGFFFLISFISTIAWAVNYDIKDLEPYFLLAYLMVAFWMVWGLRFILLRLSFFQKNLIVSATAGLFIGLIPLFLNYSENNQRNNWIYEDYSRSCLNSLPENALVIGYQWDNFISPSYYLQQVENLRKDVVIVDKELLRRSWYYHQLDVNWPDLLSAVQKEREAFLQSVRPFEEGKPFNSAQIERDFRTLIAAIIRTNLLLRPVYIAPEILSNELKTGEVALPNGYDLVPEYFFLRIIPAADGYQPLDRQNPILRFPSEPNMYSGQIAQITGFVWSARANYEKINQQPAEQAYFLRLIKENLPER